jgi:hypothetical protein
MEQQGGFYTLWGPARLGGLLGVDPDSSVAPGGGTRMPSDLPFLLCEHVFGREFQSLQSTRSRRHLEGDRTFKVWDGRCEGGPTGLSSRAGAALAALVARRLGLMGARGCAGAVRRSCSRQVLCDLAVMAAGGWRCVADFAALARPPLTVRRARVGVDGPPGPEGRARASQAGQVPARAVAEPAGRVERGPQACLSDG